MNQISCYPECAGDLTEEERIAICAALYPLPLDIDEISIKHKLFLIPTDEGFSNDSSKGPEDLSARRLYASCWKNTCLW